MISCSLLLLISIAPVALGNEACKRYANLFGAGPGYVMGTNRKRITIEIDRPGELKSLVMKKTITQAARTYV
jgi:hypothetical protein